MDPYLNCATYLEGEATATAEGTPIDKDGNTVSPSGTAPLVTGITTKAVHAFGYQVRVDEVRRSHQLCLSANDTPC